jgi:putative Mn2+ efflux pump MntP
MDAFAVATVAGLTLQRVTRRHVFRMAFHFGLFQAMMPVIGWAAGRLVYRYVETFDHWVAVALLAFVGGRMVWGALTGDGEEVSRDNDPTRAWTLVTLSIATSIDALAVGLSLAMVGAPIVAPAVVIGVVAAAFTAVGMGLGRYVGSRWGKRVELLGGIVLIAIGVKILIEHLTA